MVTLLTILNYMICNMITQLQIKRLKLITLYVTLIYFIILTLSLILFPFTIVNYLDSDSISINMIRNTEKIFEL